MAYTVLARRYRSNTFDEVIGQAHIAQTLKKAIASGRIAHAYLFCGTRGTGKTSTARILAKCLNCQSADHPVTQPCGVCESCKAIARGEDIDVIEIDAASNTGVDDVRDTIIGTAYNSPARGRFKIFIIDEVHMLSKSAFNALLKTLEEPPSHVKFILATTEPEKVLPTILSRCQRYDFRNISAREVAGHLKEICKAEKIDAADDALLLVAKAGAGSMRDSLSLLDRLLSLGESNLTVEMIEQLLGLPRSQVIFNLAAAIGAGDSGAVLTQADAMIAAGLSADALVAALVDHLRNLLVLRVCGAKSDLVEVPGLSPAELAAQAEQFDPGALSQDIVILEELRRQARQSQAGRALLDATLVRLAMADQFASIGDLLEQAGGINGDSASASSAGSQKKKPVEVSAPVRVAPAVPPPPQRPLAPLPAPTAVAEPPEPASNEDDDDALPSVGRVWEGPRPSLATLMSRGSAPASAAAPPARNQPANAPSLQDQWSTMLERLAEKARHLHGILSHAHLVGIDDGQAVIRFSQGEELLVRRLEQNGKKQVICGVISQVLDSPVGVRFEVDSSTRQSPAAAAPLRATAAAAPSIAPESPAAAHAATHAAANAPGAPALPAGPRLTEELRRKLYETEPLIRAVIDQFNGQVIKLEE